MTRLVAALAAPGPDPGGGEAASGRVYGGGVLTPELVGLRLAGHNHSRPRIQSFQAVAAPFPADPPARRLEGPMTETRSRSSAPSPRFVWRRPFPFFWKV